MLPGIRPGSVIGHVTNGIAADGIAVVSRQQVAPVGITVGIGLGALRGSQGSGGVGVFLLAEDIARVIVRPCPALICLLIVLPGQLVLVIVGVSGGIGTVTYRLNVTVIVVSVGIGNIVPSSGVFQRRYLSAGPAGGRRAVGNGIRQNRGAGVGGCPAADPPKGIVGEVLDRVAVGMGGNPVVIVVGIAGGTGGAVDLLHLLCQVVQGVILVAHAVAIPVSGHRVLHQPVCEVVVIGSGSAGGGVRHRGKPAVIVIPVGYGVLVLEGLFDYTAIVIIDILYTISIAIRKLLQIFIFIIFVDIACQGGGAYLDGAAQGEVAVGKVVGSGAGGNLRQQIVGVGIAGGQV